MSQASPLKIAILWHMHQPNYEDPGTNRMVLPWVRLHALKDYLDMPLIASQYENVRTTFNLVPSLLDQLDLYVNGATDRHLELTQIEATALTEDEKSEVIRTFFQAHPERMILPYPRYRSLYRKMRESSGQPVQASLFTSEEIRDVQIWSNLTWVDPTFRGEEPVKALFAKGQHFTEEEKASLLDWQRGLLKRVVPTYRRLLDENRLEISFTPYYHPILPLLCDTNSAREAIPGISLPQAQFRHPEDARIQIKMACDRFKNLFGRPLTGMWPSEGSVSEEAAQIIAEHGIKWIATDEEVLYQSIRKGGQDIPGNPHTVYEYGGLKLLFRDHGLSDKIGFVYSAWSTERAIDDFFFHLKEIRRMHLNQLDRTVVAIILDGENAWEYFPNDGYEFLNEFYRRIDSDPELQSITMAEASQQVPSTSLKSLFAGSWINHNFRIWIGHPEDNSAWDLLAAARDTLVKFQDENPKFDKAKLERAWQQIYRAEGSDWCWWYGDEHRGPHNPEFDRLFRSHLMAIYDILGLAVPVELHSPIQGESSPLAVTYPEAIVTPAIDGRVTHFYEWSSAGTFDCRRVGGAMHRVATVVSMIYFAYDYDHVYIRLDLGETDLVQSDKRLTVEVQLEGETRQIHAFDLEELRDGPSSRETVTAALDTVFEMGVKRSTLWKSGFGQLKLAVRALLGDTELERWPIKEELTIEVPEKETEIFWPP